MVHANMTRPLVLLSNDDGFFAKGIRAAKQALETAFDVIIVAPASEQSAASHALTLARPLRAFEAEPGVFAVDGTPADCVYLALHGKLRFLPRKPDVVVSGINRGVNLGQDVFYSGTVAAAREGALRFIPSLAASAHHHADHTRVGELVTKLALELASHQGRGRAPLLNLNVPEPWNGQVRAVRLGTRVYDEVIDERKDPRGRAYYWIGGPGVTNSREPGTDTCAYDDGAASLTSLILDLTHTEDHGLAERLSNQMSPPMSKPASINDTMRAPPSEPADEKDT
jgi:5'-nucleotidase